MLNIPLKKSLLVSGILANPVTEFGCNLQLNHQMSSSQIMSFPPLCSRVYIVLPFSKDLPKIYHFLSVTSICISSGSQNKVSTQQIFEKHLKLVKLLLVFAAVFALLVSTAKFDKLMASLFGLLRSVANTGNCCSCLQLPNLLCLQLPAP